MPVFRYWRDPLFLVCTGVYCLNQLLLKPHFHSALLRNYFNDFFLIPCALPPVLYVHRLFKLRKNNAFPQVSEIILHLVIWAFVCEIFGPHFVKAVTGDLKDICAYTVGGIGAYVFWRIYGARQFKARATEINFDFLAPHYRWMEFFSAGEKLQRCRTRFLPDVKSAEKVLIFGEGNGRFLEALVQQNPNALITCIDLSGRMLDLARRRLERNGLMSERIQFVQADARTWNNAEQFDLIVTHFFLDCFPRTELENLITNFSGVLKPGGTWLISDFCEAEKGFRRWRSKMILATMYFFFRHATNLPARKLVSPDFFLQENGLCLVKRENFEWGLLHSDLWKKTTGQADQNSIENLELMKTETFLIS